MRLANQSNVPTQRSSRWLKRPSAKDDLNSILSVERERTLSPDRKNLNLSPTTDSTLPLPPPPPPPTTIPIIEMSHSIILDLDLTKKSKRAERILCHLDKTHNSTTAYHLELNWLGGSGKLIEVNVGNWIRNLNRFGLSLMEVSCRDLEDRWNPFFDVERLEFKVGPPDSGLGIKKFVIFDF